MSTPQTRYPGERAFALFLVLVSGYIWSEAYGISGFEGLTTGGVMPMLAAAVMVLSSISIVLDTWQKPPPVESGFAVFMHFLLPLPVVVFSLLVIAYVFIIPLAGFMVASAVFLFLSIWWLWRRGPLLSMLISIVSVALIHILFRIVFQVVLPSGSFWQ